MDFQVIAFIFLLAWFITSFAPLHGLLNQVILFFQKKQAIYFFLSIIQSIISCQKCNAFFCGLIITGGDFFAALIASFLSSLYEKLLSRFI
jgi:hypothetical protein